MELRVLRYFLAVVEEGSFTAASARLHLTQPTLSRQIQELEEELGGALFVRNGRRVTPTADGSYLASRAAEILQLVEKTWAAFGADAIRGEIFIGAPETPAMSLIFETAAALQANHPDVKFRISSGNAQFVADYLDKGLIDFGIFIQPANLENFTYVSLPARDRWGVLMPREHPLAQKKLIRPKDLASLNLICSAQSRVANEIAGWFGGDFASLRIIATYNLLYNAALMVKEGMGLALCIDGLAATYPAGDLCFRPLDPPLEVGIVFAWKKNQAFSRAAGKFRELVLEELGRQSAS